MTNILNSFLSIFDPKIFEPHSVHFMPEYKDLMWFIIYSNALTVLAYVLIPISLLYIVRKRKDLVFNWIFLLFGLFITLCGITHAMHIIIFWYPLYWIDAILGLITAIVSIGTFFALLSVIRNIVKLASPKQLEETNKNLSKEIEDHKNTEIEIAKKNIELQEINKKMAEKNKELEKMNSLMDTRESTLVEFKEEYKNYKNHA